MSQARKTIAWMSGAVLASLGIGPLLAGNCGAAASAPGQGRPPAGKVSPYRARELPDSARQIYAGQWGVDQMWVQLTESGNLVKFSYHVVDAAKAAPINDGSSNPALVDNKAHVSLQIPTMEKVGPLRQSAPPVTGKVYWMAFSNKGNFVKAGHRVSVVIGQFRVDGLLVQK
jgi:hypothetical protein